MRCKDPRLMVRNGQELAIRCGQCMQCRIQRREEWAGRIMLESLWNPAHFVTLTYNTPSLVYGCAPGQDPKPTLWKPDAQRFMKRLRKRVPEKIRYFCVGEYGFDKDRPHYHFVLYGPRRDITEDVAASWRRGFVTVSPLTLSRARYTAGYTVEKLTKDTSFTDGRSPEFATMSRRPGLATDAVSKIGQLLMRSDGSVSRIPAYINVGGKRVVLDRFLRDRIAALLKMEAYQREIGSYRAHEKAPSLREAKHELRLRSPNQIADEVRAHLAEKRARRKKPCRLGA